MAAGREELLGVDVMDNIDLLCEKPNDTLTFTNPLYFKKDQRDSIHEMLELSRHDIVMKIHPTKNYLHSNLVQNYNYCYSNCETLDEEEKRLRIKIHPKSKFAKIEKKNRRYDKVTARDGIKANCIDDCSACCNTLFFITENEFFFIIAWLIMNGKVGELPVIYMNAMKQAAYVAENHPVMAESIQDSYTALQKRFYNLDATVILLESCPFLDERGKCICYEARPNLCRRYGVTDSCMRRVNPAHPSYNEILLENIFLIKDGRYYMRQARPIYFFAERYLSPDVVQETVNIVERFVTESETAFLDYVRDETFYIFEYKDGVYKPQSMIKGVGGKNV